MKEINFLDRVPTYPGRVKLTPVSGQANTYDMVRSDAPTVVGSPLDKATFNSIVHSRLTGRYYEPTLERVVNTAREGLTTSPIPTSGWVVPPLDANTATSGGYTVEVNSYSGTDNKASSAFTSTGWKTGDTTVSWIVISHTQAVKVRKISFHLELQYSFRLETFKIEASNDGDSWTPVGAFTSVITGSDQEYTLSSPGEYRYYRLHFTSTDTNRVTMKNLRYSLYDIYTYSSKFTVASGFPTTWDREQRVMILTPASINSFGVITNTLNGVTIDTILQPNKRYELRYTGSSFAAKEV